MKINELPREYLGQEPTDADLEEFKYYARQILSRGLADTEEDASELLWNDGDYLAKGEELGLID